jgi:uncharacterized membrane protein
MDSIVRFTHKYGYAGLEEIFFRFALLSAFPNWVGVILLSGLFFGIVHYRFGWLSVIGCIVGGIFLGWLYVFIVPATWNLLVVVAIHILFAWVARNLIIKRNMNAKCFWL